MSEAQKIRDLADKITTEFVDRGMIIEGGWAVYVATSGLKNAPEFQRTEMRKAFFLGAQHLFASIMVTLDPGSEATERDLRRITMIHEELEAFRQSLMS